MNKDHQISPRSEKLFRMLGAEFFYCEPLHAWLTEAQCKRRHEIAIKSPYWIKENCIDIEEACLNCGKYEKVIKYRQCKAPLGFYCCYKWFEATKENFNSGGRYGLQQRCRTCGNKYQRYLYHKKKKEQSELNPQT
jgi:hypothetical protein